MPKSNISPEQEVEIAIAYDSGMKAVDVETSFDISTSALYRILHKHKVVPHSKRKNIPEEVTALANAKPIVLPEPSMGRLELAVTVDKNDMVVAATPVRKRKTCIWKIEFTGTLMLEGESIFEALNEAKKLPMVQRIVGANIAEIGKE